MIIMFQLKEGFRILEIQKISKNNSKLKVVYVIKVIQYLNNSSKYI